MEEKRQKRGPLQLVSNRRREAPTESARSATWVREWERKVGDEREVRGKSVYGHLPCQIPLQWVHDLYALVVVAHLWLNKRVQVPEVAGLRLTDSLEQQLCDFRLTIKVRLSNSQFPFSLWQRIEVKTGSEYYEAKWIQSDFGARKLHKLGLRNRRHQNYVVMVVPNSAVNHLFKGLFRRHSVLLRDVIEVRRAKENRRRRIFSVSKKSLH